MTPWPGLCVFRYHFSPKQQSVLICGERSEQLWFQLRRCQLGPAHESPPSGGLRPCCFAQSIDLALKGNSRQGLVASQANMTGKGFKVICFHS